MSLYSQIGAIACVQSTPNRRFSQTSPPQLQRQVDFLILAAPEHFSLRPDWRLNP
jgi:hypothetical protein